MRATRYGPGMETEQNRNTTGVGPALREIREALGITRRGMGKAAKVDHTHLSRVESGERSLSPESMEKVLRVIVARLHHKGDAA